jgi:prepilin-type N-terminal cleavage/methylation domain-containing protein
VRNGFTLLEILIATVIVAAGVAAIVWAFSAGLFAASDTESVDLALNIAQAKMEELRNTTFGDLADSGPAADPAFPAFSTAVNVTEGLDPMEITVTVTWDTRGGQTSVVLTTLRANI